MFLYSLKMSPPAVNHCWMLALKILILYYGFSLQSHFSDASYMNESARIKDMLFITAQVNAVNTSFPSKVIYQEETGTKLCFSIPGNQKNADCCHDFNCSTTVTTINNNSCILTTNEISLQNHDIVVLRKPSSNFSCMPSALYNSTTVRKDFIRNLDLCLRKGGHNFRLSNDGLCGHKLVVDKEKCFGLTETKYVAQLFPKQCTKMITCKLPGNDPGTTLSFSASDRPINTAEAANIMNDLGSKLDLLGNASTAGIKMGNITGVIAKLSKTSQTQMRFGFAPNGKVKILRENTMVMDFSQSVYLPEEAIKMAVENSGTFVGVMVFPEIPEIDQNRSLFNNEMLGIEMGANVFNLLQTIDIHFSNVNTTGFNATCVSWDGKNNNESNASWITDGCLTKKFNGSITCQCSHLTFFAILMSPFATESTDNDGNPNNSGGIISSTDIKTLTQITKAGCGMSMFFLGVALFMHFLIRKNKASQATKILMNLFSALFVLNFCFLINETIADLKIFAACVVMAAVLHYSMLATFTWFFLQALHLYFNMNKFPTDIKYYIAKICTAGWVIPAMVVIGLLASSKYDYIAVSGANGTSVSMCWIPDSTVHLGMNIGYYSIVFIFTLTVFVMTVVQITYAKQAKPKETGSTKKRVFSLLGLFCLLGISWGFAFFSYGPLLLPSYYIFTILNSFQGFFLFVYYYFSSRIVAENKKPPQASSCTTENVYTSSPYQ